jgi:hypothetical protein
VINFKRSAFFSEMSFLTVIIAFSFFSKNWPFFLRFLLKVSFPFSERRISFLIYFVGIPFLFPILKIIMLILSFLFLRFSAEIIVEANNYLN